MAINIQCVPDRLMVSITGKISWKTARNFVDDVNAGLDQYRYQRIDVAVHSPGGLIEALEHMVAAFKGWRKRDVHVRTLVDASAASAAAVLFSLGDERVAEPGAMLLYHYARENNPGPITAEDSAKYFKELARIDERIVEYLVERALKGRTVVPHQAETADREVLMGLVAAITGSAGPLRRRPRVKALAERLGGALYDAVLARDRKTLSRAYRKLAKFDRPISASLARTLRLVDRIGDTGDAPERSSDVQIGLTIPEWRVLYPPSGEVPRSVLTRHTLVLGETGSGKSFSVILPLLMALARAPRERFGGAFVIDPKLELLPRLKSVASERLQHVTTEAIALNVMVGEDRSIDADLAARRWRTAAHRILLRAASFARSSPLRVLGPHKTGEGHAEFFDQEGTFLLRDVLAFILMLTTADAPRPEQWIAKHDVASRQWVEKLNARARGHDGERGLNALALCFWAICESPLVSYYDQHESGDPKLDAPSWLFARLAQHAHLVWGTKPGEGRELLERVSEYWLQQAKIDKQHGGTLGTARVACAEYAAPQVARTLYFGCEPGWRDAHADAVDFASLASSDGDGRFVLYQPKRGTEEVLVARTLKALFFEAVLADPARIDERERGGMPLVGYIADEFQDYVTSDAVHGEQSFLDRCRSFGGFCVLATQSTSSIRYALSEGGGDPTANEMALNMLLTNTATKYFFRSTDPQTPSWVEALSPRRPGFSPVTAVRPLTMLAEGECYVALANGRFDRKQLDPVMVDQPRSRRRGPDAPASQDKSVIVDDRGGGHAMDAVSVQPMELLSEALANARVIWDANHLHQAYRAIVETHYAIAEAQAEAGTTGGAANTLTEALASAQRIEDAGQRVRAHCAIAEAQAEAGTAGGAANTLTEALASAQRIEDAGQRVWAHCAIAEAQAEAGAAGGAANTLTEALASAQRIEDAGQRVWALHVIAEAQAATGDVEGASATARRIESADERRRAHRAIAEAQAATGDIEGASATARRIEDVDERDQAHRVIAEAQAAAGDIEGASATARRIEDAYKRNWPLHAIAGAQAAAGDIEGALASAQRIDIAGVRAQAHCAIAGAQAAAGDIEGACTTARRIEDSGLRHIRTEAYCAIAEAQAAAGDIEGALASAQFIEDADRRDRALHAIAGAQAAAGDIEGACTTARRIKDATYIRAEAYYAIAGAQAAAGDIEGACATARRIEDATYIHAQAYCAIAGAQAVAGDIEGACATARRIEDLSPTDELLYYQTRREIRDDLTAWRDRALHAIAGAQAAAGDIEGACTTARSIMDPYICVQALCALALTCNGLAGGGQ